VSTAKIRLPPKLVPVFSPPRGAVQYRGAYGGRGSGKSFTFALMAAVWGYAECIRVLCTRDLQASIKESFHAELKAAIAAHPWLEAHYDVGIDYLRGKNGTEFIFRGLRHNTGSIKSLAKIDLTIVEEAEDVPDDSWLALEATVFRQPKSELWAVWNPRKEGSPVDKRFRVNKPDNALIIEMNHYDNPFFPVGLETLRQREQERLDPATYAHVWEGAYLTNSDAQVLSGKVRVAEFSTPTDAEGPYHGADWGFAQDPTTGVKCWVKGDTLMVEYEAYKVGLDIDDTAAYLIERIPGITDYVTRGDSARPETISYLKRNGLPRIEGVKKWPGSVEDGVQFMRSFREIIIHPRCKETIKEARLYSYKVDKLTGDILPVILDANNHMMDAIRYALQPMIKNRGMPSIKIKMN
jgi:phage terminase large subunit